MSHHQRPGAWHRHLCVLGRGGFAEITQIKLRSGVLAVKKTLHAHHASDPNYIARMRNEAKILGFLTEVEGIPLLYDDLTDQSPPSIIMEYLPGVTLSQKIKDHNLGGICHFPIDEAIGIGAAIALILQTVHQAGLVHRDVKPDNVISAPLGQVYLIDFGICIPQSQTDLSLELIAVPENTLVSTLAYAAPEQVAGPGCDPRTDIYQLGLTIYEMLCGCLPFSSVRAALRATAPPPKPLSLRSRIGRDISELVVACLEVDASNRPSTVAEVRTRLLASA